MLCVEDEKVQLKLRKMLLVVKMRGGAHSIDMTEYQITEKGVVIGEPLRGYHALTSGIPEPWSAESGQNVPELRAHDPTATKKEPRPGARKQGKRRRKKQ